MPTPGGLPPPGEPSPPSSARPDLFIVEAGEPRDRTCAECGKKTARWKPGRRRGAAVILFEDCTAKPGAGSGREAPRPCCGVAVATREGFSRTCGLGRAPCCAGVGTAVEARALFDAEGGGQ